MKKVIFVFCLVVLNITNTYAQVDSEANFYTPIANANYNKDLVADYGVDNDFTTDDSAILQTAIDEVSANGGGVLVIPAGNYSFANVSLKSNVHLDIDDGVVIKPAPQSNQNNYRIFDLGRTESPIENVTITSSSGNKFKVDLTQNSNPNVAVFNLTKVSNFVIANCEVDDALTKFSAVTCGGKSYNNVYTFPVNGIVKDIDVNNADYGYGVVQTQSAENMLFKNLSGIGGATLSFKTGATALNNLQVVGQPRVGGLDNMVGRNISSTNGNGAVMLSPHALHNGSVYVESVTAVSSGFAVRVEGGFISTDYDQTIGLTEGTFENVVIKDVTATFGANSQLKAKHINPYMPAEYRTLFPATLDYSEIYIGPSIAVLVVDGNYLCNGTTQTVFIEEPIVGSGFLYQPTNVVPSENETINCGSLSVEDLDENEFELVPNPASDYVTISSSQILKTIEIYNLSGMLVKSFKNIERNDDVTLSLTDLNSGMYFVKAYNSQGLFTRKLIIK